MRWNPWTFRRPKRKSSFKGSIQLWLKDLGEQPETVMDFLVEDQFVAGGMEAPADLPKLPWMMLELPAASDTWSIIHIQAVELEDRGAVVCVREV